MEGVSAMRSESFELTGPVLASITVEHGHVLVRGDNEAAEACVRLAPMVDGDQVAAALIERATVEFNAGVLTVIVPPTPAGVGAGGVSVVRSGGGMVITQNVANVVNSVVGVSIVNGRVISGGTVAEGGGVRVEVTMPERGDVTAATVSADLDTSGGELDTVGFHTTSGDLRVGIARSVAAHTVSGDVVVDTVSAATVRSTSGDVELGVSTRAEVSTISGDVDVLAVRDGAVVAAHTISGDIRVTPATPEITITLSTSTVTGKIRGQRRGGA